MATYFALVPVTNLTQLNLPHLTVSRSAVINAQGDVTNSSATPTGACTLQTCGTIGSLGSQNLTNWSNIPTGAMANIVAMTFLTNWANAISNYVTAATNSASVTNWITTRQPANAVLSNFVRTVARNVTNVVSLSTTNATSKPLTNSYTGDADCLWD